jgi:hypothetical protein
MAQQSGGQRRHETLRLQANGWAPPNRPPDLCKTDRAVEGARLVTRSFPPYPPRRSPTADGLPAKSLRTLWSPGNPILRRARLDPGICTSLCRSTYLVAPEVYRRFANSPQPTTCATDPQGGGSTDLSGPPVRAFSKWIVSFAPQRVRGSMVEVIFRQLAFYVKSQFSNPPVVCGHANQSFIPLTPQPF